MNPPSRTAASSALLAAVLSVFTEADGESNPFCEDLQKCYSDHKSDFEAYYMCMRLSYDYHADSKLVDDSYYEEYFFWEERSTPLKKVHTHCTDISKPPFGRLPRPARPRPFTTPPFIPSSLHMSCPVKCKCETNFAIFCESLNLVEPPEHLGPAVFVSLRDNNIQVLESVGVSNIQVIDTLNLAQNAITEIPAAVFSRMPRLIRLLLSHNKISNIADDAFSGLAQLQELDLNFNNISNIPVPLTQLTTLRGLQLSGNNIQNLGEGSFSKNLELVSLSLSHNQISHISARAFHGLWQLIELDLSSNPILTIRFYPRLDLPSLEFLDLTNLGIEVLPSNLAHPGVLLALQGNPLLCDWNLLMIRDFIVDLNSTVCASPRDVEAFEMQDTTRASKEALSPNVRFSSHSQEHGAMPALTPAATRGREIGILRGVSPAFADGQGAAVYPRRHLRPRPLPPSTSGIGSDNSKEGPHTGNYVRGSIAAAAVVAGVVFIIAAALCTRNLRRCKHVFGTNKDREDDVRAIVDYKKLDDKRYSDSQASVTFLEEGAGAV